MPCRRTAQNKPPAKDHILLYLSLHHSPPRHLFSVLVAASFGSIGNLEEAEIFLVCFMGILRASGLNINHGCDHPVILIHSGSFARRRRVLQVHQLFKTSEHGGP